MSLRLTKPGMRSANLAGKRHPKTGELLTPLGYLKNGTAVWPVMGASSDDPDDPEYTRGDDDDEDDEDETEDDDTEDEEEDDKSKSRKSSKKSKSDEDDDADDDEDSRVRKASQQAKRYRLELRKVQAELTELKRAKEDEGKKPDEIVSRDLTEARSTITKLTDTNRELTAQIAFFRANVVDWVDPSDAFTLALNSGILDDAVDEDGNVDARELRRGLRELAKRKPHLVKKIEDDKKARGRRSTKDEDEDEDDEDEEEEPRSTRRSASTQNGRRKGSGSTTNRAALAKRFPVLNKF